MITATALLSTAYFPPAEYFSIISHADAVLIERHENYHKQTWRNRCSILGANGVLDLSVPVLRGSFHKTAVTDIKIDESRRWRENHIRAVTSAYANAPYFEFYFDIIREVMTDTSGYLLDLNMKGLEMILRCLKIEKDIRWSESFTSEGRSENDFRYTIAPKSAWHHKDYREQHYIQVFSDRFGFVPGLSIIDILLNNGPGTKDLILRSLV